MIVAARSVHAGYGPREVLAGIDLDLASGSLAALVGPNGAGKSTLLRCLAGLIAPTTGSVAVDGRDLRRVDRAGIARLIAVVPQATETLFPFTVREIVALGRVARLGLLSLPRRDDVAAVDRAIDDLELGGLAARRVDTLSGGERQRTVLAMALAQEAPILLLDEPTAHLDPGHQRRALALIRRLVGERALVALAVLQDLNLAASLCDRVIVLDRGRVVADGPPSSVLRPSTVAEVFGRGLDVGERAGVPFVLPSPAARA